MLRRSDNIPFGDKYSSILQSHWLDPEEQNPCVEFMGSTGYTVSCLLLIIWWTHDDVIKWKHFPRYWPFVRGIHRSSVKSLHKSQWCGAVLFSFICAWVYGWANSDEAGDLRRHRAYYDVIVMKLGSCLYVYTEIAQLILTHNVNNFMHWP